MNKSLLTLAGSLLISATSFAQITLTAANSLPQFGEKYVNHICDTTGVTPGLAGANITWNFTSLSTTSIDTAKAQPCGATPNCSLFPGSTYAIVSNSTRLIPYYIGSTTKLSQNGYYQAVDSNAVYSDAMDQLRFPFTYNNTYNDPYSGVIRLGAITAQETGTISVTCDAYGTLQLPGGLTHNNVLRVRTFQVFKDSTSLFGSPFVLNFELETYTWYKDGYHSPLMTILSSKQVGGGLNNKGVSYAPVAILDASQLPSLAASVQVFPNPVSDELNIHYSNTAAEPVSISLTDMMGKEVAQIVTHPGGTSASYNTASLPRGLYILRLQSGAEVVSRKISVQ